MPLHCGLLAGNVAICASCDVVTGWAAVVIGLLAGLVYLLLAHLVEKAKLDDPVEAVAVHGGGGIAGIIAIAFFHPDKGILYQGIIQGHTFLGWQLCGLVVISAWSFAFTLIAFIPLRMLGVLRALSDRDDKLTIDEVHGHETAYPETLQLKKLVTAGRLFRQFSGLSGKPNTSKAHSGDNSITHDKLVTNVINEA